jgi:ribosomal protein L27
VTGQVAYEWETRKKKRVSVYPAASA